MNKGILLVTLATLTVSSVWADVNPTLPADTSRVVDLDEVVVVAQPKETASLRLQPLSSNVLTSLEMRRLNMRDLSQLSDFIPSFQMPQYGSRLTSSLYMRGIGSRVNGPAVGIYYDNIPLMTKAAFNHHFYMIDRVDVLRGPQSTLYGQNTEGGLVRIYSKNPMNYQGTDVRLGLATGLWRNVEVAHYARLSDQVAVGAAGFYSGLKGFIDNQNFSDKNDKSLEAGGKLRLIYAPTDKLNFDWTADFQWVSQNGFGYGELNPDNNEVQDPATTIMNGYKRSMLNTGLTISYAMPSLLLTSTTSYQFLQDRMDMDQDYMTADYLQLQQRQKQNALTEELVLRSSGQQVWQHASGLFASYQWMRTDAPVCFGDAITGPIGSAIENAMKGVMIQQMAQAMIERGMPEAAAMAQAATTVEGMGITMGAEMGVPELFHTPALSLGAFHESNVMLGDHLKLTLGLRLNYDRVKIDYDALAYMAMTGGVGDRVATYRLTSSIGDNRSKSYTQLLPKFGLTWLFGEGLGNVYALVSKGYRSGGYNIQMFSDILQTDLNANQQKAMRGDYDVEHTAADYDAIEQTIAYRPEESWNFELGTHLNLFDGKLHADLSLYYMKIRNQQLSIMTPNYNYGRIMTNAGKSHSCGAELSLRGSAFDNRLEWGATYAFTNARFDEYDTYEDNYVPFIPQHSFGLNADWHIQKFTIGANLTGQGKTWWNEANTFSQKFYAVLGAHADYDFGPVVVSLWGRNLTDTKYNTFAIESSAAGGQRFFAQRATPLQVGIDVNLHF